MNPRCAIVGALAGIVASAVALRLGWPLPIQLLLAALAGGLVGAFWPARLP